jgi:hypothetical protein
MYPSSENTNPNATINPTLFVLPSSTHPIPFLTIPSELSYFHFGLSIAHAWKSRLSHPVPSNWTHVLTHLAPLPIFNSTYPVYEGIPNMWVDPNTYYDHPSMSGIFGLLPPATSSSSLPSNINFNVTIMRNTAAKIGQKWNFTQLFGWDFPMLAMNSARLGDPETAVKYLLDENFVFDDAGYPVGGPRVATPYFPASGGLLLAVAGMEGGWDGADGQRKWPKGWKVKSEGFKKAM